MPRPRPRQTTSGPYTLPILRGSDSRFISGGGTCRPRRSRCPVRDMGEAVRASLRRRAQHLPARPSLGCIGFASVLIVGWLVSSLARPRQWPRCCTRRPLQRSRSPLGLRRLRAATWACARTPRRSSRASSKWFVRLITLVVAFDLLGLPAVSVVLQQLLLWLPNLLVALVVLVIGGLAANALSQLVRGTTAEAGLQQSRHAGQPSPRSRSGAFADRGGREPARHRDDADQHAPRRRRRRAGPGLGPRLRARRARPRGPDPRSARPPRTDPPGPGSSAPEPARSGRGRARRQPRTATWHPRSEDRMRAARPAVDEGMDRRGGGRDWRREPRRQRHGLRWREPCGGATRFAASSSGQVRTDSGSVR